MRGTKLEFLNVHEDCSWKVSENTSGMKISVSNSEDFDFLVIFIVILVFREVGLN